MVTREQQDRYLPVLFQIPVRARRRLHGLDLYSVAKRQPLIDRSIEEGAPVSSGLRFPLGATPKAEANVVVFYAPIYRAGRVPMLRDERRNTILGLLTVVLNVGELLDVTMASNRSDLHVSLFDFDAPAMRLAAGLRNEPELAVSSAKRRSRFRATSSWPSM